MSRTLATEQHAAVAPLQPSAHLRKLDTAEAADLLRVRPQTLRRALCLQGHYMVLKPAKLPNRTLI